MTDNVENDLDRGLYSTDDTNFIKALDQILQDKKYSISSEEDFQSSETEEENNLIENVEEVTTPEENNNSSPENPEIGANNTEESANNEEGSEPQPETEETVNSTDNNDLTFESLSKEDKEKAYNFFNVLSKPIKASGKEILFDNPNEILSCIQKGVDYTQKTQRLAKYRNTIDFIEQNKLTSDQLVFAKDLIQGNPEAIKQLIKQSGFDTNSFNPEEPHEYVQDKVQEKTPNQLYLTDIINDIPQNDEGNHLYNVLSSDLDQTSANILNENPEVLNEINQHVKNGTYKAVINEMENLKIKGMIPNHIGFIHGYDRAFAYLKSKTEPKNNNNQSNDTLGRVDQKKVVKKEVNVNQGNNDLRQVVDTSRNVSQNKDSASLMQQDEFENYLNENPDKLLEFLKTVSSK